MFNKLTFTIVCIIAVALAYVEFHRAGRANPLNAIV